MQEHDEYLFIVVEVFRTLFTDIPVYWKLSQFMNLDIVYSFYIIVCT